MDIQNPVRKLLHKPSRQQPHVTREADQLHAMLFQRGHNFSVMLLARLALRSNHQRGQSTRPRSRDTWYIGLVRDDDSDPRIRNTSRVNTVRNGDKVRAASGEKYA